MSSDTLLNQSTDNRTSKSSTIGMAVGIPLAVCCFVLLLLLLWQRQISKSRHSRRQRLRVTSGDTEKNLLDDSMRSHVKYHVKGPHVLTPRPAAQLREPLILAHVEKQYTDPQMKSAIPQSVSTLEHNCIRHNWREVVRNKELPETPDCSKSNTSIQVGEIYTAARDFEPQLADELRLRRGEQVLILATHSDGWCLVKRLENREDTCRGVIPGTCLAIVSQEH